MRSRLRVLLPLTVLVAAPLLGIGGRAQAAYMPPASLVDLPHADSLLGAAPQINPDEMGSAASEDFGSVAAAPQDDMPIQLESPGLPQRGKAILGLSPGGAGSQPSPNTPGSGASSQVPAATCLPAADPPALVGVLFLETASRRPPPFPSRLFRPPRLS